MKLAFLSSQKFSLLTDATRRPSATAMADLLRAEGVEVSKRAESTITRSPNRLAALHQVDFEGQATTFEHIERLAKAKTLVDGSPSAEMAADLFALAGRARQAEFGRCYARTNHTVYSVHHAAEMTRLVTGLAVDGKVTLASGIEVKWNPKAFPLKGMYGSEPAADRLWGALNHLLKEKNIGKRPTLKGDGDYASNAQMANITGRLMGEKFVNVEGDQALPHLNQVVDAYGPMLAEYGAHGGSVAKVVRNKPASLEEGATRPEVMQWATLGYVVVPAKVAEEKGLKPLAYRGAGQSGYAKLDTLEPAGANTKLASS